jgi:hypothetical protein
VLDLAPTGAARVLTFNPLGQQCFGGKIKSRPFQAPVNFLNCIGRDVSSSLIGGLSYFGWEEILLKVVFIKLYIYIYISEARDFYMCFKMYVCINYILSFPL